MQTLNAAKAAQISRGAARAYGILKNKTDGDLLTKVAMIVARALDDDDFVQFCELVDAQRSQRSAAPAQDAARPTSFADFAERHPNAARIRIEGSPPPPAPAQPASKDFIQAVSERRPDPAIVMRTASIARPVARAVRGPARHAGNGKAKPKLVSTVAAAAQRERRSPPPSSASAPRPIAWNNSSRRVSARNRKAGQRIGPCRPPNSALPKRARLDTESFIAGKRGSAVETVEGTSWRPRRASPAPASCARASRSEIHEAEQEEQWATRNVESAVAEVAKVEAPASQAFSRERKSAKKN